MWEAANSPTLCPVTTSGSTPNDRQVSARATSRENSSGWKTSMSSIRPSDDSIWSTSEKPRSSRIRLSERIIDRRNTAL